MISKAVMPLIAMITILICPCLGEYQNFTIWHYNASLDLGGKNVTAETLPAASDLYSTRHSTFLRGSSASDCGAIYLFDSRRPTYSVPAEGALRSHMIGSCKAIRINPGNVGGIKGLIAKGEARVEHGFGQAAYGGIIQLAPLGSTEHILFMVIGHFLNESLNEQFVKKAKIDYIG